MGKFSYLQGDFVDAIPRIEHSIRLAERLNDRRLLAISTNLIGRSCLYTCNYSAGITYLDKGLALLAPFGQWDDIVYSTAFLRLLQGLTGSFKSSLATIAGAIKTARKHEIPTFEAMAFGYLGAVQYWCGNWKAAINNCNKCIAVSRRLDNPLPIIWATLFRGVALFNLGDRKHGLAVMARSIEMMAGMESVLALRFFCALYAECLALNGSYGEAESTNKKAMALGRSGQKWGEIASCRTRAILAASANAPDWDRVEALMRKCIVMAEKSGAATELVLSIYRHADMMRGKGDEDTAQAYYLRYRQLAGRIGGRR